MAIVLVVMGLVMLTVLPALTAVRSANQLALTQSNLRNLMLATASYVQANGCLPCPAVPGNTGANFGRLGYSSTTISCGTCSAPEGIAPFVALGVPASTARDGWGHWITMRVDPALTANFGVTPPTAGCQCNDFIAPLPANCTSSTAKTTTPTCTTLNGSQKGFCQSNLSASKTYITITTPGGALQEAAVIFVSHGSTGYGSFVAAPRQSGYLLPFASNYASCSAYGGYAQCNSAANNSTQFYDAPTVISNTDSYDDVLAYADRNTLVSMLGSGSCGTVW
jgi:type II secretory pathway pseudopilin PulG